MSAAGKADAPGRVVRSSAEDLDPGHPLAADLVRTRYPSGVGFKNGKALGLAFPGRAERTRRSMAPLAAFLDRALR